MIKRRFVRTNKRRYLSQLTAAEVRERFMRRVAQRLAAHARRFKTHGRRPRRRRQTQTDSESDDADGVDSFDTTRRYHMADSARERENVLEWLQTNRSDVASTVRYPT